MPSLISFKKIVPQENNDPLDIDDDLYDEATNTSDIEQWNGLFGASDSDGENVFKDFE